MLTTGRSKGVTGRIPDLILRPRFPFVSSSVDHHIAGIHTRVVADAIAVGVKHIWMQSGAEDDQASKSAREAGIIVIDDGSCILVLLARQS